MTMKHTLTDLSQLSKAMFKAAPNVDEVKPTPPKAKPHDDGEEVLAYFSRPAAGAMAAQNAPTCAPAAGGADAQAEALKRDVAARPLAGTSLRSCASLCSQLPSEAELPRRILRAQLRDSEAVRSDAETKCADLEREREKLADALAEAKKNIERLGFKLVSGRTHWKLEYGNVRMPIAKTHPRQSAPSGFAYGEGDIPDYRANLNMATDLANRCF